MNIQKYDMKLNFQKWLVLNIKQRVSEDNIIKNRETEDKHNALPS
jgi:hypothetical protein